MVEITVEEISAQSRKMAPEIMRMVKEKYPEGDILAAMVAMIGNAGYIAAEMAMQHPEAKQDILDLLKVSVTAMHEAVKRMSEK